MDGLTDRQTDGWRVELKSPPVKPVGDTQEHYMPESTFSFSKDEAFVRHGS